MTDLPPQATEAALEACYASAADTIPEIVETALACAAPHIAEAERQRNAAFARATAAEWRVKNRIDPDGDAHLIDADALDRFADLLDGLS